MNWQLARQASLIQYSSDQSLISWLAERQGKSNASVEKIPLNELKQWQFERCHHGLVFRHESGRFFRMEGRHVQTNFGTKSQWDQAIVVQPERGLLGLAGRIHKGVLEFLVQSKMEPGCVNAIQISPTIQATRSNYTRVHKGKAPDYLDLFHNDSSIADWIVRSPQIEQTTRFEGKKNINAMRILPDNDIPVGQNFRWCTLRDLKDSYLVDNAVNMNLRSILATLPPLSITEKYLEEEELIPDNHQAGQLILKLYKSIRDSNKTEYTNNSLYDTMVWLYEMRERYWLKATPKSLDELDEWVLDDKAIKSPYFSLVGARITAEREITQWDQPLIYQSENGISVLVGKTIEGMPHFLFQAKCDIGGDPAVHLAPTLSCSVPSQRRGTAQAPPFLDDIISMAPDSFTLNVTLSEEGGRFMHCKNDYKILWDENFPQQDIPDNYRWIPYPTVFELIRHGHVNIEARSILGFLI